MLFYFRGLKYIQIGIIILFFVVLISFYEHLWSLVSGYVRVECSKTEAISLQNTTLLPKTTPTPKPFLPDSAHKLLILSYQRCGSSFFGDIFGRHPSVVYYYEPLDGVYVSLYGTAEGWNVPSDITNYSNGSERYPPQHELDLVTQTLDGLLNCNIDMTPNQVILHRFWKTFSKEHQSLAAFQSCFGYRHSLDQCRVHIAKSCAKRFNASEVQDDCLNNFNQNKKSNGTFYAYNKCISTFREAMDPCINSNFADICQQKPFRAVKTVRATMASVERLVQENPNLRVVHLIRDPRAVVLSRKHFDSSGYGLYSTLNMSTPSESMDMVKEAKLYCSTVLRDVIVRRYLQNKYPSIFMEVIYDEFAKSPIEQAKNVYNFVGIEMDASVEKWLKVKVEGIHNDHTTSKIANKWQHQLTFAQTKRIDKVCSDLYEHLSFVWPL